MADFLFIFFKANQEESLPQTQHILDGSLKPTKTPQKRQQTRVRIFQATSKPPIHWSGYAREELGLSRVFRMDPPASPSRRECSRNGGFRVVQAGFGWVLGGCRVGLVWVYRVAKGCFSRF